MNKKENLALVAMEECAEIQQAIAKALRFGYDDTHPERSEETNQLEILTEFYQLTAMIEELQRLKVLEKLSPEKIAQIKKDKLAKVYYYQNYSKEQGLLTEE